MSNEIQAVFTTGMNLYALIRNSIAKVWDGSTFSTYVTANYASYPISLTQQGTSESYYAGNFPTSISAGVYDIVVKQRIGSSPAETDPPVAMGEIQWNGATVLGLSELATSGQLSRYMPFVAHQGQMIAPFTFKLVSSVDSKTPFVSGTISGQISRDGSTFGPLQSGAYTEMGLGWYALQALTSGDMNARTVSLTFQGARSGGGNSDPRDFSMILQKVSG